MLNWVEHEKRFITVGARIQSKINKKMANSVNPDEKAYYEHLI